MWSLETNRGSFEGETLKEAIKSAARWTVDDMNGEHSPTPDIESIRIDHHEGEVYVSQQGVYQAQEELEEWASAMQDDYADGEACSRETQPYSYM